MNPKAIHICVLRNYKFLSKINQDQLRAYINDLITTKKDRKFVETVELQIGLKDYDPEKDKRF